MRPRLDRPQRCDALELSVALWKWLTPGVESAVSPDVWSFRIGAHAPARKWLADRAGRALTPSDLRRYADLVGRVRATIDVVRRISEVAQ